MAATGKSGSLTAYEKRIVKALLAKGLNNQDVHALINFSRERTVNFGRISGVKRNSSQEVASAEEVEYYILHKNAYDHQTGLNRYDDERLIRAREAMILAVQIFNSAALRFKTEVFTVLASIAWTYLLHEFYNRKGVSVVNDDGNSLLLSQMVEKQDCPLSNGARDNIRAIRKLRDKVEHLLLGKADLKWLPLFQACCLNFDKALCELFGDRLTLSNDLSLALQFARLNIEQASMANKYEIPEHMEALDAHLMGGLNEGQLADLEFQFRVIYTLDAAAKSRSHFQFIKPDSAEGKEIHNVLGYFKAADELYPHKPNKVVKLVAEKGGIPFSPNDHTKAWRYFKARPKTGALQPENTDRSFCLYHQAHGDYTYSDAWIDRLVESVADPAKLAAIRAEKV